MAAWRVKNPRVPDDKVQCSLVQRPTVFMSPLVQAKLKLLMEAYPHQEWCGYLQGQRLNSHFWIRDIAIPPHEERSSAHCLAEPFHTPKDTVGFLHSHHQMGAFHSGQDARTVDVNYELSITIAKRSGQSSIEYDSITTVNTICNHKVLVRTGLILVEGSYFLPIGWLVKAKENIDKPLYKRANQLPAIIQIPVPALRTTTLIKPVTIDREGNLHDRNGRFVGKNRSIKQPTSEIYYQDSQGQLFTQQDIDNIREGKRI